MSEENELLEVAHPVMEASAEERAFDQLQLLEIGSTGLNRWGGNVSEEFLPNLQWPNAARIYKEMSDNDPVIGAILYMAEQLIRRAKWDVIPASDLPADKEAADFVRSCMEDMSSSWEDTISEILSYFTYGWAFHEIVYKVRRGPNEKDGRYRSKYADGRIGWRKIPPRSQHTMFQWVFNEQTGGILGLEQIAPPMFKHVYIPLSRGLLFRSKSSRDNPEGRSLLRNAYRPWYFKKRIEEIEGIGIERDLAGLPVLTPPEGVNIWDDANPTARAVRSKAELIVRNVRRDKSEGIVIPFGWDFKLVSTGGTRQFDTNAIINRYDQRIAITMLSDIVMLGADKVGSFALADVKKSLLIAALEAQLGSIASIFNKYAIAPLLSFNYFPGISGLPRIQPGEIEVPGLKELGDFFKATGLNLADDLELTNFVREIATMPTLTQENFDRLKEISGRSEQKATAAAKEATNRYTKTQSE